MKHGRRWIAPNHSTRASWHRQARRRDDLFRRYLQPGERRKVQFEPLEPRILLSGDLLFEAIADAALTLRIDPADSAIVEVVASGTDEVLASERLDQLDGAVRIEGDGHDVDLTLDASVLRSTEILEAGGVVFDAGAGHDTLIGSDAADVLRLTGEGEGSVGQGRVRFAGVENLIGGAGDDRFLFTAGASVLGRINGGEGSDTVGWESGENDRLLEVDMLLLDGGQDPAIDGVISFDLGGGDDVVTLRDDAMAGNGMMVLDWEGHLPQIIDLPVDGTIEILLGDGADTLTIESLDSAFAGSLILVGGTGADVIDAGAVAASFGGTTTIEGGTGNDTLSGTTGDDTYRYPVAWDTDTITDPGGIDTLDFQGYGVALQVAPGLVTSGVNRIEFGAGIEEIANGTIGDVVLDAAAQDALLDGLRDLVAWGDELADYGDLSLPLSMLASDVGVSVGGAMDPADVFEQLRLEIKNDSPASTQALMELLDGFSSAGVQHFESAIIGDTFKPALVDQPGSPGWLRTTRNTENYTFEIELNDDVRESVTVAATWWRHQNFWGSHSQGYTKRDSFVNKINDALAGIEIAEDVTLADKILAVLTAGRDAERVRIAFQVIDIEVDEFTLRADSDAQERLGFLEEQTLVVNKERLEGLGKLSVETSGQVTRHVGFDAAGDPVVEFEFHYGAERITSENFDLDLGDIVFPGLDTADVTSTMEAHLGLGLKLGGDPEFFVSFFDGTDDGATPMTLGIDVDQTLTNQDVIVGFLGGKADGTIGAEATVDVEFDTGSNEPIAGGTTVRNASADVELTVDVAAGLSTVDTGGASVPFTPGDVGISVLDANPFRPLELAIDDTDVENFTRLTASDFGGLLVRLRDWFADLGESEAMSLLAVPFASADLGSVFDLAGAFNDELLFPSAAPHSLLTESESAAFTTAQELASWIAAIPGADVVATYAGETLTYEIVLPTHDFTDLTVPVAFNLDLSPISNVNVSGSPAVEVGGHAKIALTLGVDLAEHPLTPGTLLEEGVVKHEHALTATPVPRAVYTGAMEFVDVQTVGAGPRLTDVVVDFRGAELVGAPDLTFDFERILFAGQVDFDATANTVERTDAGNWVDDGFRVGDEITISGVNGGTYTIAGITPDDPADPDRGKILTLSESFTTSGTADVTVDAADKILRSDAAEGGDWAADGFRPGMGIVVAGSALGNAGPYTIVSISEDGAEITLAAGDTVEDEDAVEATITSTEATIRSDSDWGLAGFTESMEIRVSDAAGNNGTYTIDAISADGRLLTLASEDRLVSAEAATVTIAAPLTVTFEHLEDAPDTITRLDGLSWYEQGFREGQVIAVEDAEGARNFTVDQVSAQVLTLGPNDSVEPLVDVDRVSVTAAPPLLAGVELTFAEVTGNATITREDGGSWEADGFMIGQFLAIVDAGANDGTYRIAEIAGNVLTLAGDLSLESETVDGVTALVPDMIRLDDPDGWADAIRIEAGQLVEADGSAENDGRYVVSLVATDADSTMLVLHPAAELTAESVAQYQMARVSGEAFVRLSDEAIFEIGPQVEASVPVRFDHAAVEGAADTITRTDGGDWAADGFREGMLVTFNGTSLPDANDGPFTIAKIDGNVLTLADGDTVENFESTEPADVAGIFRVAVGGTADNTDLTDLVEDVRTGLGDAGLAEIIEAGLDGNRLVLTALDEIGGTHAFTLNPLSIVTSSQLGFQPPEGADVATADAADLVIITEDGTEHRVALDDATNVAQVITTIGVATGGAVVATIDEATGDRLRLESSAVSSGELFRVETVNGSAAAIKLGILGSELDTDVNGDGVIDGRDADGVILGDAVAGLSLADRFFVRDPSLTGGLTYLARDGIAVRGSYGFVGVDMTGPNGTAYTGKVEIELIDPTPEGDGTQITLAELSSGLSDVHSLVETPEVAGTALRGVELSFAHDATSGNKIVRTDGAWSVEFANAELIRISGAADNTNGVYRVMGVEDDMGQYALIVDPVGFATQFTAETTTEASVMLPMGTVALGLELSAGLDQVFEDQIGLGTNARTVVTLFDAGDPFADAELDDPQRVDAFSFELDGNQTSEIDPRAVARVTLRDPDADPDSESRVVESKIESVVYDGIKTTVVLVDGVLAEGEVPEVVTFTHPAAIDLTSEQIGNLDEFTGLEASDITAALIDLSVFLRQFETFGFLGDALPVVDVSLGELLGAADDLAGAVGEYRVNPAFDLQMLEGKLLEALGLPASSGAVKLENPAGTTILGIELNLETSFAGELGLNFDLGEGRGVLTSAEGPNASGFSTTRLVFGVDLDGTEVYLFESTEITGYLDPGEVDPSFDATIGPLFVTIENGDIEIRAGSATDRFAMRIDDADAGTDYIPLDLEAIDLAELVRADLGGRIDATLPLTMTAADETATVEYVADLALDGYSLLLANVEGPQTSVGDMPLGDLVALPEDYSLLDSALMVVDGLDSFLAGLQSVLEGDVFGLKLPIVGQQLAEEARFIEDLRLGPVADLRGEIADLADPSGNIISELLYELLGPAGAGAATGGGVGLLLDTNGDGRIEIDDVVLTTNIDKAGVPLRDQFIQWTVTIGQTLLSAEIPIGFDIGIPGLGLETDGEIGLELGWEFQLGFGLSGSDGFYFDLSDPGELEVFADVDATDVTIEGQLAFLQLTAKDADLDGDGLSSRFGTTFAVDIFNKSAKVLSLAAQSPLIEAFRLVPVDDAARALFGDLDELSQQATTSASLTAENDAQSELTEAATFRLTLLDPVLGEELEGPYEVHVDPFGSGVNVVDAVNLALAEAGVGQLFQATVNDYGQIVLTGIHLLAQSFRLTAESGDPAVTQLGFATEHEAVGRLSPLTLTGIEEADLTPPGDDPSFRLYVTYVGQAETYFDIDVPGTSDNKSMNDLLADVNRALEGALGASVIHATREDARLNLAELKNLGLGVGLAAEAVAELELTLGVSGGAGGVFPEVTADFLLEWGFGGRDTENKANESYKPLADVKDALTNGLEIVEFQNISLDLGPFISEFVAPILEQIQSLTEPIQPVIEFLTTPIPVISDLGPDVTFLDLAAALGQVDPGFLHAVADVITLVNSIPTTADSVVINFGDLKIFEKGLLEPELSDENADLDDSDMNMREDQQDQLDDSSGSSSTFTKTLTKSEGFSFPILTDPTQVFNLILGKPATLFEYDLPDLLLEFTYNAYFPIFGPLGAEITGAMSLVVDFHSIGFDTYGIQQFADRGYRNPELIFNGFFINDLDKNGIDVPEVALSGSITAGAVLNLGIFKAGVAGGVFADIAFNLNDPDHDGKVRVGELIGNFNTEARFGSYALAPLAIFDISGQIYAQLYAFIKFELDLGFWTISWGKTWNITPRLVIFDFDIPFAREREILRPQLATDEGGGTLRLNMGEYAEDRLLGNTEDGDEAFTVTSVSAGLEIEAVVGGERLTQTYLGNYTRIVASGGAGNDRIDVSGVTDPNVTYDIDGGSGNDTIRIDAAGAGTKIHGGSGHDRIIGGAGAYEIWGDAGDDWIFGGAGADVIYAGSGKDHVDGRAGADELFGEAGDDLLYGGGGLDLLDGGADDDEVWGYRDGAVDPGTAWFEDEENLRDDEMADGADTLRGGSGEDALWGGIGDDKLYGDADRDTIRGEDGNDTIEGGSATDWLYGGDDVDTIHGDAGNDRIEGGAAADTIHGGTGNDTIEGGSGADTIYGDADSDTIHGEGGNDTIEGGSGGDTIYGGAGSDEIHGGSGADTIHGDAEMDEIYGDAGNDTLFGGDAADTIYGGDDDDTVYGGNAGDFLYGGSGADAIYGGGGDDTVRGDADDDVIHGDAGSDTLYGDDGDDILLGDSGMITLAGGVVTTIETAPSLGDGADTIQGDADDDIILGGSGGDELRGGDGRDTIIGDHGRIDRVDGRTTWLETIKPERGDADTIEGNEGDDVLLGGSGGDAIRGDAGDDVILGDGGMLGYDTGDGDASTLDLILGGIVYFGGADIIRGNAGDDILMGGMATDILRGGNGALGRGVAGSDNDVIFGDYGRVERVAGVTTLIETIDECQGDADAIEGNEGDDVLLGGGGHDSIGGNTGDDIILGDNGLLDYDTGDGDAATLDLISTRNTLNGGFDVLEGNAGDDVLMGGVGEDVLLGGSDDDTLFGDHGKIVRVGGQTTRVETIDESAGSADQIAGEEGNDLLFGGHDDDDASGGAGADVLLGDHGFVDYETGQVISTRNTMHGGVDKLVGNAGDDVLLGGVAGDTLWGGFGQPDPALGFGDNDIIFGDHGRVYLADGRTTRLETIDEAHGGADRIQGNEGNDVLLGGAGSDEIEGHSGHDVLIGDNGWLDYATGDGNPSTLDMISTRNPTFGDSDTLVGGDDNDVIIGGAGDDLLWDGHRQSGREILSTDNDIIFGDHGRIVREGGWTTLIETIDEAYGGSDLIVGNEGHDILFGGFAGDTITGLAGPDIILGDNGQVHQEVGSGDPFSLITVTDPTLGGADVITAGEGRDIVLGGTAGDTISGGDDHDILFGDHGRVDPDAEIQYLAIFITEADGGGADTIHGDGGDDFIFGQQAGDLLYGGADEDDITGGHNVIGGADAGDVIFGGGAADVILGDNGRITRIPVPGQPATWERHPDPFPDVIRDVMRFDDIDFVGGDDTIHGEGGDDILRGQRGDDTITGGAGDDEMFGGLGADTMSGDAGNDVMLAEEGTILRDHRANGSPRINTTGSWHRDVMLEEVGAVTDSVAIDTTPDVSGLAEKLLTADLLLLAGAFNEDGTNRVNGNGGWETALLLIDLADSSDDSLDGGAGYDVIFGQRGADTLSGGDEADMIFGDGANNTVPFLTDMPHITNGLRLIGGGSMALPKTTLRPQELVLSGPFTLEQTPSLLGALPPEGGMQLRPYASIVPDVAHHLNLLSAGDTISGGGGDDLIVGDDVTVRFEFRTGLSAIDEQAHEDAWAALQSAMTSLHALSIDFDLLEHELGVEHGRYLHVACDQIDAGDGDDVIIGDDAIVLGGFLDGMRADEADFVDEALAAYDYLRDFERLATDLDYAALAAHDQVREALDLLAPTGGWQHADDPQYHDLVIGHDNIDAGGGSDLVVGDSATIVIAAVDAASASTVPEPVIEAAEAALVERGWERDVQLAAHVANHHDSFARRASYFEIDAQAGNDHLSAGAGDDFVLGDFAIFALPVVSESPETAEQWIALASDVDDLLDDIEDFLEARFDFEGYDHDLSGGDESILVLAGNDWIYGNEGDDLILGDSASVAEVFVFGEPGGQLAGATFRFEISNLSRFSQFDDADPYPAGDTVLGLDADWIHGGTGDDVLVGQWGEDEFHTGGGIDSIHQGHDASFAFRQLVGDRLFESLNPALRQFLQDAGEAPLVVDWETSYADFQDDDDDDCGGGADRGSAIGDDVTGGETVGLDAPNLGGPGQGDRAQASSQVSGWVVEIADPKAPSGSR